tara:strand:- start:72 stop:398 length:327 start_codon:yes stop_codon:yes gene_type:complete
MDAVPLRLQEGGTPGGALYLTSKCLWEKYTKLLQERDNLKANLKQIKTWGETLVRRENNPTRARRRRLVEAVTNNKHESCFKEFYTFMMRDVLLHNFHGIVAKVRRAS